MSSQKKASVLLHADFIDDPPLGYNKDALDLISEHFNIVWLKEVERDPALGKQVEGIFLKPGRHVKILDRLDCFPNAKVLVNNGVGYDHVPVKRLADRGIRVGNTPRVLAESVADMAMCLLLASARDLLQGVEEATGSNPITEFTQNRLGMDVTGASLGIVGMGEIGYKIAERAKAFKMKIYYHNRNRRGPAEEECVGATYCSTLLQMLPLCDFVVIICPLTPATTHMFGATEFQAMKTTGTLINISRGKTVNQEALLTALRTSQIRGAALDVSDPEPLPRDHPLLRTPGVLLTSHLGSATRQCRQRMMQLQIDNVLAVLQGKPMPSEVLP